MTARAISPGPGEVFTAVFAKRSAGRLAEEGVLPGLECRQAGLWVLNMCFPRGLSAEVEGTLITTLSDPLALLRSKSYLALLVLAAIIGVPISAAAYFFLALVSSRRYGSSQTCPRTRAFTPNRCGGRSRRWCWSGCWSLSPSGTCQVRAATRQPTGSRWAQARPPRSSFPASCSRHSRAGQPARDELFAVLDLIHGLGRAWNGRRFWRASPGE